MDGKRTAETVAVPVEALTASAFAPYGWLLAGGLAAPSHARPGLDVWALPFRAAAPVRLQIMRYRHQAMRFSQLERHVGVTEGRTPLAGSAAVLVVAGTTDNADPRAVPAPDVLRAFLMDGSCGVMFRPGLWHALDCFPLTPPYADFLFLSDEATETEIEAQSRPASGRWTHVVDYAETLGLGFAVSDPAGLLS